MKCEDKKCKINSCICRETLNHIRRIEGQVVSLREKMEQGRDCENVAILTKSISKSFSSFRNRILKNFVKNELLNMEKLTKKQEEKIEDIFNLYK